MSVSAVHEQAQCPLFAKLPSELRVLIYEYALTRYEDLAKEQWLEDTAYYRPGFTGPKRLAVELLQSCRKIYHEARLLPVAINEHAFWFEWSSRRPFPPDAEYFEKLSPEQQENVNRVHLFAQLFVVEDGRLNRFFSGPAYRPRVLTLTFRHTDFWGWEDDEPLHFQNRSWMVDFHPPASVRKFVIEFETVTRKKQQLDGLIEAALDWKFSRTDGLTMSSQSYATSYWNGALLNHATMRQYGLPSRFRPLRRRFFQDQELRPAEYVVVAVTWCADR